MRWLGIDLANRGHTVLGVRLPGHGTAPSDLRRVHAADWLAAIADGVALLQQMAGSVFLVGFSLGGALALITAAKIPVRGVVTMATPYERVSFAARARVLVESAFPRWAKMPDARSHAIFGDCHQAVYPAYATYPTAANRQLVRVQSLLQEALPAVSVPVLIAHSQDDAIVDPASARRIHARLGSDDKRILWLDGFGHAMVRAARRRELFDEVGVFLSRVEQVRERSS
ncbi:alpha/beta fold hydrolase [Candidatus Bipolaricaulota bacterium]|nr:alpha/beta fold hydrolase [Candidatus Bipolaricaulota bacterium]